MLFGGAPLGSRRYIWWNFVASLQRAHRTGKGRMAHGPFLDIVPGDEQDFIPLPE
ncbi:hypothetical protein VXQ18_04855 [Brucella abortus]|nr:hypothetical protein [Brucella abortus]